MFVEKHHENFTYSTVGSYFGNFRINFLSKYEAIRETASARKSVIMICLLSSIAVCEILKKKYDNMLS
jgi:hypothetical protein